MDCMLTPHMKGPPQTLLGETQAVVLLSGHEHLVWGELLEKSCGPPDCTVMVEPTNSYSTSKEYSCCDSIVRLWMGLYEGHKPNRLTNNHQAECKVGRPVPMAGFGGSPACWEFTANVSELSRPLSDLTLQMSWENVDWVAWILTQCWLPFLSTGKLSNISGLKNNILLWYFTFSSLALPMITLVR